MIVFGIIGIFGIIWFLQDSNKRGRSDLKGKPSSVTLRILINHCQTLLLVGGLHNHGPSLFAEIVRQPAQVAEGGIVSSINGLVECDLGMNFFQRTYVVACLPLLMFVVACVAYSSARGLEMRHCCCTDKERMAISKGMIRVGVVSMFLIHPTTVDQLISSLQWHDEKIESKYWVLHDMGMPWGEGDHLIVLTVSTIALVLYGILLPIMAAVAVRLLMDGETTSSQHNVLKGKGEGDSVSEGGSEGGSEGDSNEDSKGDSKEDSKGLSMITNPMQNSPSTKTIPQRVLHRDTKDWINKSIGFLTKGYRRHCMWWEMGPVLVRKLALMLTSRIVKSAFVQSWIALLIVLIAYHLQISFRPFARTMYGTRRSYANDIERLSLGTIAVTLFVSLLYTQYPDREVHFTIGLLGLNFFTLLYLSVTVAIEMRYESAIKVHRRDLLRRMRYDSDVKIADRALLCVLPRFRCCFRTRRCQCCRQCFPALEGLEYVSFERSSGGEFDDDDDDDDDEFDDDESVINVDPAADAKEVEMMSMSLRRQESRYSVAFKVNCEEDLDADLVASGIKRSENRQELEI